MALTREQVIVGVSKEVAWWLSQRIKKLLSLDHESMAVNPFMAPAIMGFHGFQTFSELAEYLISAHLAGGHATGFGKLMDEKILPRVFGTTKLSKGFRAANMPYENHLYDEVDHLVYRNGNELTLLSLKASRWTIQLTMAVQLNTVFAELIRQRAEGGIPFDKILVGVIYGTRERLSDKYDLIRGINRGAGHQVLDIQEHVDVLAGREFWAWINEGEAGTQEWMLEGIIRGYEMAQEKYGDPSNRIDAYKAAFNNKYSTFISEDGKVDWFAILASING